MRKRLLLAGAVMAVFFGTFLAAMVLLAIGMACGDQPIPCVRPEWEGVVLAALMSPAHLIRPPFDDVPRVFLWNSMLWTLVAVATALLVRYCVSMIRPSR